MMDYKSNKGGGSKVSFERAILDGYAIDGGLYVPKSIKKFSSKELLELKKLNYNQLSTEIINIFTENFISKDNLSSLVNKSYSSFREKEVVKISKIGDLKLLELFHGPTLAFKDVAMQLIGQMFEHVLRKKNLRATVIAATSGDTGAAAMAAFKNSEMVDIYDSDISNIKGFV